MNLLFLLFAHHVADVWAQPTWLIANKRKHGYSHYEHAFLYAGIVSLAFYGLGLFAYWMFWWFFLGHFAIDYTKYRVLDSHSWYIDQTLHYLQILAALWMA